MDGRFQFKEYFGLVEEYDYVVDVIFGYNDLEYYS